jgi:hypothetical protein
MDVLLSGLIAQELARGDPLYQRNVSFQEIESGQFLQPSPDDLVEYAVLQLAMKTRNQKESQLNRNRIVVVVADACHFVLDLGIDPQFFLKLAAQSIARLLSRFDLAARKLPLQRHGLMLRPLAYEDLSCAGLRTKQQSSDNLLDCAFLFGFNSYHGPVVCL